MEAIRHLSRRALIPLVWVLLVVSVSRWACPGRAGSDSRRPRRRWPRRHTAGERRR